MIVLALMGTAQPIVSWGLGSIAVPAISPDRPPAPQIQSLGDDDLGIEVLTAEHRIVRLDP